MGTPTWSVGQVLAASDVNSWFVPLAAYKTSNLSRTSTTMTIDPDLQVTLAANAFYNVTANLDFQNIGGTGAFQWNFQVPSGALLGYGAAYNQPGPVTGEWSNGWGFTVAAAASDNLSHGVALIGTISTSATAGTLGLVWALNAASGTITLYAGSGLTVQRVG